MGKILDQQRRGKGSPSFKAPSHRYVVELKYREYDTKEKTDVVKATVKSFKNDPARSGLLMYVVDEENNKMYLLAPEGIAIGEEVQFGVNAEFKAGNVFPLDKIPDGTPIFNIELVPGDGGKFIRSAGNSGTIVSHTADKVYVSLPSKNVRILNKMCRAQLGLVSVGGRLDKPIFTAGKAFHMNKNKARRWPKVRGVAMNAVDHPYGGKQHHAGRPNPVKRTAPPGQKVGLIGAASPGRSKGKKKKKIQVW
ncbi:MAG: 50S ribosomal protein L2 [Proteobacteria bacterium]|nr:50S ribosomal protein L2 [Pseudomonadota bacterium]